MNELLPTTEKKKGRESYSSNKLHAKRNAKRRDAEARQQAYDDLTLAQRLARAKSRRGNSTKEITRLTAQITASKKPVISKLNVAKPVTVKKSQKK